MNTGTCLQGYICIQIQPSTYIVDEVGKLLLNGTYVCTYITMWTSPGKLSLKLHDMNVHGIP